MEARLAEKYLIEATICGITSLVHFACGDLVRSTRWGKVSIAYRRKADKLIKGGLNAFHN